MSVYFIQAGDDGPVKIGFARNIALRLVKMQADSPVPLQVIGFIASGNQDTEQELHVRFATYRQHGEWFAPSPEITEFAGTLERWKPKPRLHRSQPWRKNRPSPTTLAGVIGFNISSRRLQLEMTQATLAKSAEISRVQIANVEAGRSFLGLPALAAVARKLDISVDALMTEISDAAE